MDTLTVKIHEYIEETHSLIVSFSTDTSNVSVDEAEKFNFEIANYNPDDMDDTLNQIVRHGALIAHRSYLKEQSKKNDDIVNAAKDQVGKVYNYQIADFLPKDILIT